MFEYVVSDIMAPNGQHAIDIAMRKAHAAKFVVMSIKRVNEKKNGRYTVYTVVLVVTQS